MRVVFAGTPEFAQRAMVAIAQAGHEIVLVLTQPDRPSGRGMKLTPSPVKEQALQWGVAVAQPQGLRLGGRFDADAQAAREALQAADADVMVVAAYGLILPADVLAIPRHGCLNIHASLLPRWRGAAPIQRAIEAGDAQSGVTIMQMDVGLDTGPMILALPLALAPDETSASLFDRLAGVGAQAIVRALERLQTDGRLESTPQPEAGVTHAAKIDKAEAAIDWTVPAAQIERRLRAFDPFPGATAPWKGERWKIWSGAVLGRPAAALASSAEPGVVIGLSGRGEFEVDAHINVAPNISSGSPIILCGDRTALALGSVQRPGGRRIAAAQAGWAVGDRLAES